MGLNAALQRTPPLQEEILKEKLFSWLINYLVTLFFTVRQIIWTSLPLCQKICYNSFSKNELKTNKFKFPMFVPNFLYAKFCNWLILLLDAKWTGTRSVGLNEKCKFQLVTFVNWNTLNDDLTIYTEQIGTSRCVLREDRPLRVSRGGSGNIPNEIVNSIGSTMITKLHHNIYVQHTDYH